jgi:hypothetical protein
MKSSMSRNNAMQKHVKTSSAILALASSCALAVPLFLITFSLNAMAAQSQNSPQQQPQPKAQEGQIVERNFYDVLEDVLSDFEYDLKNGQVKGLKELAIRNIAMSENIPPSFRSHLELVISERILRNTKSRLIQCLPCRSKRTTLNGDQVMITSPDTNPQELSRIAKISNIEHFMDVAFSYQPSGMVLSMYITEPESGGIIWSRSYNSEASRASAFRRGVDYSQVDDARKMNEYQPMIQYRLTGYYLFEKNVSGTTGCLGLGFRMVERYDNRRKEVGFEADYLKDATSIVDSNTSTTNLYSGLNFTILFVHTWNFIEAEENFNMIRGALTVSAGGTYASGFLGGLIRVGYEWRLAKHWAVSANGGYRPPATAFVSSASVGSVTGPEFGMGVGYIF